MPTALQASVSGSTVTVSWANPSGTLGNNVYRDGSQIAWPGWPNLCVTTYQDTAVVVGTHTYSVAAYNSVGVGPQTAAVTVTVAATTPPTTTPPTGSGHHQGGGGRHHSIRRVQSARVTHAHGHFLRANG